MKKLLKKETIKYMLFGLTLLILGVDCAVYSITHNLILRNILLVLAGAGIISTFMSMLIDAITD